MFLLRHLFLMMLLVVSSPAFTQTSETKSPDAGTGASTGSAAPAIDASNPCTLSGGIEVLSDTKGVDFGPYLSELSETVRENWNSRMPPSVYPPISKKGRVSIEFVVMKDGKVSGMAMHGSSYDVALDRAAWASISSSSPFAPLPEAFTGPTLGLRFFFYYNVPASQIGVSPCKDVRVPAASTQQFRALGKGADTTVTWSVSGPGCVKAACGTISDQGLYTAPVDIPKPATVLVEARSGTSMPGTVRVTIVPANH